MEKFIPFLTDSAFMVPDQRTLGQECGGVTAGARGQIPDTGSLQGFVADMIEFVLVHADYIFFRNCFESDPEIRWTFSSASSSLSRSLRFPGSLSLP